MATGRNGISRGIEGAANKSNGLPRLEEKVRKT
jgi:hypothetical protein